ncbi:MAG: Hpt domain-containing protein, partial [Gammaproteobacteria bacterium]|nr:Hpt domain-containing protein [Gammaproteobacteria bacterium]
MSDIPSVDMVVLDDLREILEDQLHEILNEFKDEIPFYKKKFEKFYSENDVDNLIMLSHSIKSSSGNLGLMRISDYCRQIEEGLRNNPNMDLSALVESSQ